MENINDFITRIIQIAHNNLSVGNSWRTFTLKAMAIRKFIEINALYFNQDNEEKSFDPVNSNPRDRSEDLAFLFLDLRKAMFDLTPDKGSWFTCLIEVESNGNFNVKYDYDNKPPFAYEPVDEKYIDDFKHFPREKELVPDWLKEILLRNNITV